jgi:hypothetical protein
MVFYMCLVFERTAIAGFCRKAPMRRESLSCVCVFAACVVFCTATCLCNILTKYIVFIQYDKIRVGEIEYGLSMLSPNSERIFEFAVDGTVYQPRQRELATCP